MLPQPIIFQNDCHSPHRTTDSNYFISFNTETMRQISSSYPISSMCRFRFAVDVTEVRIFFLKAGGQSLHKMSDFSHPHRPRHKTSLNDHTTPCCFVASTLLFVDACGGATLVAGVVRLGVFSATY